MWPSLSATKVFTSGRLQATLSDSLNLQWRVAAGRQIWVVYDTVSRANLGDYASRTAVQFSFDGSARATVLSTATGSRLFFRFVAQDGSGNMSFSAEQSLTVPPRFSNVAVTSPAADTLEVTARFDAGTVNPTSKLTFPHVNGSAFDKRTRVWPVESYGQVRRPTVALRFDLGFELLYSSVTDLTCV
jgi:hypothetical protein